MVILLLTALCGCAAFLSLTIQADIHHTRSTQAQLTFRIAGLHKTFEHGQLISAASNDQGRGRRAGSILLHAPSARRFLLRHIHLEQLDGLLCLYTNDAAHTAMLCGTVRNLVAALSSQSRQQIRLCIIPAFFHEHGTVRLRCIIRIRLGTLLLTAAMLLLSSLSARRLTEREAT